MDCKIFWKEIVKPWKLNYKHIRNNIGAFKYYIILERFLFPINKSGQERHDNHWPFKSNIQRFNTLKHHSCTASPRHSFNALKCHICTFQIEKIFIKNNYKTCWQITHTVIQYNQFKREQQTGSGMKKQTHFYITDFSKIPLLLSPHYNKKGEQHEQTLLHLHPHTRRTPRHPHLALHTADNVRTGDACIRLHLTPWAQAKERNKYIGGLNTWK